MVKHEPLCLMSEPCGEEDPTHGFCSRQQTICIHCQRECICKRLKTIRLDERQALSEDIANMLRALPFAPANSRDAIEWAEKYVKDILDEAD